MVNIDQQPMDDVLSGAFEGGITYWASAANFVSADEPRGSEYTDKYYTPKNCVWELITEDGKVTLTYNKLWDAIEEHKGLPEDWDADDYDTIVQMACFGEIVYG